LFLGSIPALHYIDAVETTGKRRAEMAPKSTIFERLKYRLIVEEVNEQDRDGRRLLYLASVYVQVCGRPGMRLVRRSRIPGSAAYLERDVRLGRIDVGDVIHIPTT
jgi:hypothetical protein